MNLMNEELTNGILQAYQERCKALVLESLGKGTWNTRELDWLVQRLSTYTKNVETLLDSLVEYQAELEKEEISDDECTEEDTGDTAEEEDN